DLVGGEHVAGGVDELDGGAFDVERHGARERDDGAVDRGHGAAADGDDRRGGDLRPPEVVDDQLIARLGAVGVDLAEVDRSGRAVVAAAVRGARRRGDVGLRDAEGRVVDGHASAAAGGAAGV